MRLRGIKIRLFPDKIQNVKLWQSCGTYRWCWNWGLSFTENVYKREGRHVGYNELSRKFTRLRNSEGYSWLLDISCRTEQNALRDIDKAYKNFYRMKERHQRGGLPKYKTKGLSLPTFQPRTERIKATPDGHIYIEKIGYVRYKAQDDLCGIKIHNARVRFDCGKWLMTCSIDKDGAYMRSVLRNVCMGIDVGIKSLAVVSCGGKKRVFRNINRTHKVRRLIRQIKHHQRILARKQKDSANRLKERKKLRDLHSRLKHIRHDYIHRVTRNIVNMKPKVIVLEDLSVANMMKNKHTARAVAEQNLYMFRLLIEYKDIINAQSVD